MNRHHQREREKATIEEKRQQKRQTYGTIFIAPDSTHPEYSPRHQNWLASSRRRGENPKMSRNPKDRKRELLTRLRNQRTQWKKQMAPSIYECYRCY